MARLGFIKHHNIAQFFKKARTNERGNTAMVFAFAFLPILAAVGLSVDGGRVFLVKSQLSSAVDVTALTATRLYNDEARDTKAREFFTVNFTADNGDVTLNPVEIDASSTGAKKTVTVTASAVVNTLFMKLFGIPTVTVSEEATAARTDYPIELVMALDNTGSMALDIGGGVSRLRALKTAAEALVDSMYGTKEDDPKILIGIIPYTAYVNVGRLLEPGFVQSVPGYTDRPVTDALGWKGCVDADESNTAAPDDLSDPAWSTAWDTLDSRAGAPIKPSLFPSFSIAYDVNIPSAAWSDPGTTCPDGPTTTTCDTNPTLTETRCVEATCYTNTRPNPKFNVCVTTTCTPQAPFSGVDPARTEFKNFPVHEYNTGGNDALFSRANPFPTGLDMDGANVVNYRYIVDAAWHAPLTYASRTTNRSATFPQLIEPTSDNSDNDSETINEDTNNDGAAASPNTYCPQQALPLAAHSKTALRTYINNELKAFNPDWGTFSNQGLLWGWRMVSPAPPLLGKGAGAGFNKAVVLMTDGEMYHPGGRNRGLVRHDGNRTSYGFGSEKTLLNTANPSQAELINALYNRLKKTCQNMRRAGVEVYTVTLDPTMSAAAKDIYRSCATTTRNYFDTPDAASLNAAFNAIADNLAGVRLVE
jgi:Flp pilus assembly protein TadG